MAVDALGGSFRGQVLVRNLDRYTVTGDIADFQARRVVALYSAERLPWDSLVSGQVNLEGSLLRPIELRVSTNLDLAPVTESPPVHGQIAASYEARSGILDLGRSSVTLPSSRAVFSGAVGREMRVQLGNPRSRRSSARTGPERRRAAGEARERRRRGFRWHGHRQAG